MWKSLNKLFEIFPAVHLTLQVIGQMNQLFHKHLIFSWNPSPRFIVSYVPHFHRYSRHFLKTFQSSDIELVQSVACRGLKMPGATAWLDAPYQVLVLSSGVWWSSLLDMRCLWRRNMTSYSRLQVCWHMYIQGRRSSGREAVKELKAMETYKNKKS